MERSSIAVGLMSGTSADGIDAVVVRTDGMGIPEVLAYQETPYARSVRQEILDLYVPSSEEIERMGRLDQTLGVLFAQSALEVCAKAGVATTQVSVIGSHGQTIRHRPPHYTCQIGQPAVIAARTGIRTIADFRQGDLALGGEGAPLTPLFHRALFADPHEQVVVLNLGGIANVTVLPNDHGPLIAGDTGPANGLIDLLIARMAGEGESDRRYDGGGEGAAAGRVDPRGLAWLMEHPYLQRAFPKSTGREMFGSPFLSQFLTEFPHLDGVDGLATLTAFTAESVALACRRVLKDKPFRLVVCGGGEKNRTLMRMLLERLPQADLRTSRELGVDGRSLESQCFAWFAVRTLNRLTSSLPEATGAVRAAVLGALHMP